LPKEGRGFCWTESKIGHGRENSFHRRNPNNFIGRVAKRVNHKCTIDKVSTRNRIFLCQRVEQATKGVRIGSYMTCRMRHHHRWWMKIKRGTFSWTTSNATGSDAVYCFHNKTV
jgi:hypothetical protein